MPMSSAASPTLSASPSGHAFSGVFSSLQAHMGELDTFLHGQLTAFEPEIRSMVDYCIDTSGKRIRPALVFLSGWTTDGAVSSRSRACRRRRRARPLGDLGSRRYYGWSGDPPCPAHGCPRIGDDPGRLARRRALCPCSSFGDAISDDRSVCRSFRIHAPRLRRRNRPDDAPALGRCDTCRLPAYHRFEDGGTFPRLLLSWSPTFGL